MKILFLYEIVEMQCNFNKVRKYFIELYILNQSKFRMVHIFYNYFKISKFYNLQTDNMTLGITNLLNNFRVSREQKMQVTFQVLKITSQGKKKKLK